MALIFTSINKMISIIIILNLLFFILILFLIPPIKISVNPLSINESFAINDNLNKSLIRNIMIKNVGPTEINLHSKLEINGIRDINNDSKTKFPDSYINISLNPDQPQQIKSGDTKFLSVSIDASKAYLHGDYKGAIILSANDNKAKEIICLNVNITAAKSGNSNSGSIVANKGENQANKVQPNINIASAKSGNNSSESVVANKGENQTNEVQPVPM